MNRLVLYKAVAVILTCGVLLWILWQSTHSDTHKDHMDPGTSNMESRVHQANLTDYKTPKTSDREDPTSLHINGYNICTKGNPVVSRDFLLEQLPEFIKAYEQRPSENYHGTKFSHQFAMWSAVKKLKPLHIIESGIYRGLGTWILRQAAPNAQLILLDPSKSPPAYTDKHPDSRYFTGANFKDFGDLDWTSLNLDLNRTLVYFDDHQSGVRRTLQAYERGFKYVMFDDNFGSAASSDNLSMKLGCYVKFKYLSPREVQFRENFPRRSRPLEEKDLKLIDRVFDEITTHYMEFPLPWSSDDQHNNTLVKNNNRDGTYKMDDPNMQFWYPEVDFHNVCLVKLK